MSDGFIYLASPYSVKQNIGSHQAKLIRNRRYKQVCQKAAELMLAGETVFCPIAHSHPIETIGFNGVIKDGNFWLQQDFPILAQASKLLVYQMNGWQESYGVKLEIEFALANSIPVEYLPYVYTKRTYKTKKTWIRGKKK
jgi:hypothetical protein